MELIQISFKFSVLKTVPVFQSVNPNRRQSIVFYVHNYLEQKKDFAP
jgi:hypothetical protein